MGFFAKALGLLSSLKSNKNQEGSNVNNAISIALSFSKIKIFMILIPVISILIVLLVITVSFANDISQMQMVDPHAGDKSSVVGDVVYDEATLEEYYNKSEEAYESPSMPSSDLAGTEFQSIVGFNQHIKDTVEKAGYGTRQGVVAAGMSLVGDYIKYTGKRLRYDQGGRQYFDGGNNEGIINEDFYLDCSSFAWWALYNGGFNIPCWPYTGSQREWSDSNGYSRTPGPGVGQGGDYLVSSGHIVFIVGTYDGGYYCAEESAWGTGAIISKRSYEGLGSYTLIDMTDYYNNSANVRN